MSVLRFAGDKFIGLEADLTTLTALEGATFFATDTLKVYLNVGGDWEQIEVDVAVALGDISDVALSGVATGQVLRYNGVDWVNHSLVEADISDLQDYLLDITGESVGDLSDVTITTPQTDQVLAFNGTGWVNVDLGSITTTVSLNDVTDVTLTSSSSGDFLRFNGTSWVNSTIQDGDISASAVTQHQAALTITESQISDLGAYIENIQNENIGDLQDVSITTPLGGQTLFYDTGNWVNRGITEADITDLGSYLESVALGDVTDVTLSTVAPGNFLRFNGTAWVNVDLAAGDIPSLSATYQIVSEKGQPNGYASLNASGKVPVSELPALAITEVFVVADITARDNLPVGDDEGEVQEGDVAVVTDASDDPAVTQGSASYIYDGTDWVKLRTPDVTAPGADTQIIFNDEGEFGASEDFTFDDGILSLEGKVLLSEGGAALAATLASGEAAQFVVTGTGFTRLMARVGNEDVIIATYVED